MERLGLALHPEKTRMVDLPAREGELRVSGVYDSQEAKHSAEPAGVLHAAVAVARRRRSDSGTACMRSPMRGKAGQDVKQIIAELNPVLRGWGNYFRTGNAGREFNKMDGFVCRRLASAGSTGGVASGRRNVRPLDQR